MTVWAEERVATKRHYYFSYFAEGTISMDDEFNLGHPFELDKVRLHLGDSHASVVDFVVRLGHHLSATYDQTLLSQPMNGVEDVMFQLNPTIKMHQSDDLALSMVMSAANTYGLEISGWAITEGISMSRE